MPTYILNIGGVGMRRRKQFRISVVTLLLPLLLGAALFPLASFRLPVQALILAMPARTASIATTVPRMAGSVASASTRR